MKVLTVFTALLVCLSGYSQSLLPTKTLSITYQMTTNIIFPYTIDNADIGSSEVIGYKGGKHNNVLFLKAARQNFTPTNVSIFTSDGKFYSFIVKYKATPDTLNLSFAGTELNNAYPENEFNAATLDSDATSIKSETSFLNNHSSALKMKVVLQGVYITDKLLWFKLKLENKSQISYAHEPVRFFVRDRHPPKRTPVQENELFPVYSDSSKVTEGEKEDEYAFALNPFTIRKSQVLVIELTETNGARTIVLPLKSKVILKARPLKYK